MTDQKKVDQNMGMTLKEICITGTAPRRATCMVRLDGILTIQTTLDFG